MNKNATNNYLTIEIQKWPHGEGRAQSIGGEHILLNYPMTSDEVDEVHYRLLNLINKTQPADYFETGCKVHGIDPRMYSDITMRVGNITGYIPKPNGYAFTGAEISTPAKYNPNWHALLEQAISDMRNKIPFEREFVHTVLSHNPILLGKPMPFGMITSEFPVSNRNWVIAETEEDFAKKCRYHSPGPVLTAAGRALIDRWNDYKEATPAQRLSPVYKDKSEYIRMMPDGTERIINEAEMLALVRSNEKYSVSLYSDYNLGRLNNGPEHIAIQEEWNSLLSSAKSPILSFPNGDYYYVNYNHDRGQMEIGTVMNAGFSAYDAIDVDYAFDLDSNISMLYESFIEKNPSLLDEPRPEEEDLSPGLKL